MKISVISPLMMQAFIKYHSAKGVKAFITATFNNGGNTVNNVVIAS